MSHVCHLYSNTMELWTPNPIPHLSFQDTLFCMITCLFAPLYAFFPCLPLYALPYSFVITLLVYWLSFLCCCRSPLGARVQLPRCKQEDASPKKAMFSSLGVLASRVVISFSLLASFFRTLYLD